MRPDDMPRNSQRDEAPSEAGISLIQRLRDFGERTIYAKPHMAVDAVCDYMTDADAICCEAAEEIDRLMATIKNLERLARSGHGPVFTQSSVATSRTHIGIGKTTDDFCAAIVALGRMSE